MRVDLPKYQAYKPTDVEWIGDIPEGWEVRKLRRTARILRGKFTHRPRNDPRFYDGQYPFIQTGDVARASKYVAEYSQTLNDLGFSVSKQFPSGTLVMTIAANVGDIAILGFEACFPDSIVGFVPAKSVKVEYLFHVFTAMRQEFMSTATLGTQLNLNVDRISSIAVPLPTVAEQAAILTFLDRETAKIDRLMAVRQKQVERLQEQRTAVIHHAVTKGLDPQARMKPSGIDWLPMIPSGWQTHRLRRTTSRETNGFWGDEPIGDESDITCIRVADFDRLRRRVKDGEKTMRSVPASKRGARLLRQGDLLLEKSGGGEQTPVGCVVLYEGGGLAITSNFVAKLTPLGNYDGEYLCYLHQALYDVRITKLSVKQTTGIQNLDSFWYLNELAPFPPRAEQVQIVAHIDRETAKLDTLIAKYQRELELLAEYRASLISHAVTGKIDVRGLVEPTPLEAA